MVSNENGVCIFKAIVTDEKGIILSTGTAYEKEGSTFINKTSYIENCETSAVGRALGIAGFGIDTSVASAEEVQKTMDNQEEPEEKKATKGQVAVLNKLNIDVQDKIFEKYNISLMEDLTLKQASEIISKLKGNK